MAAATHPRGLIDTDIFVDANRGILAATDFLHDQLQGGTVLASVVTAMELTRGCRNASDLRIVQRLIARISVIPLSAAASEAAYRLMDRFFLSHGLLIADSFIAATAIETSLTLYTKNIRDFRMIHPGSHRRPALLSTHWRRSHALHDNHWHPNLL